jgi:hypothetical protein
MINLERSDYQIVSQFADERGLGDKGLSAAIRMNLEIIVIMGLIFPDQKKKKDNPSSSY